MDIKKVLRLYAQRGISEWRADAPRHVKRAAENCLGAGIAEKNEEMWQVVHGNVKHFVPMPKVKKIDWCFFLPRLPSDPSIIWSFDVVLLRQNNTLGMRFEPSHGFGGAHGYSHVQFCRELDKKTIPLSGVPQWLPISYPAIPIPAKDSLEMFLSVGVAMHGYRGGMASLLQEIFQADNRAREAIPYLKALRNLLC